MPVDLTNVPHLPDRWVIMPFIDLPEMTWRAVEDALALDGGKPTRVLLIDQGSSPDTRRAIDAQIVVANTPWRSSEGPADYQPPRVLCWHFNPSLPSLSAAWNLALRFVWDLGGTEALVVNNDVRLHPRTYEGLLGALNVSQGLFVSGIGVRESQFVQANEAGYPLYWYDEAKQQVIEHGGPDFSCFLISKAGHLKYPFDELFIPAYCEDLDCHRRYMLGGDGDKIFGVNLPFAHLSSQTLNSRTPHEQQKLRERLAGSAAYYARKWGGPVNREQWLTPFNTAIYDTEPGFQGLKLLQGGTELASPTTPELQAWWRQETAERQQRVTADTATRTALRKSYEACIAEGEPILDANLLGLPPDED